MLKTAKKKVSVTSICFEMTMATMKSMKIMMTMEMVNVASEKGMLVLQGPASCYWFGLVCKSWVGNVLPLLVMSVLQV